MYSRKSWGGSVDPFILIKFIKAPGTTEGDPLTSMIIFEWKDEHLIGRSPEGTVCTALDSTTNSDALMLYRTMKRQFAISKMSRKSFASRVNWALSSWLRMHQRSLRTLSSHRQFTLRIHQLSNIQSGRPASTASVHMHIPTLITRRLLSSETHTENCPLHKLQSCHSMGA